MNLHDQPEIEEDIKELYELTAKVARRCLYDLKHCIEFIPPDMQTLYYPRYENFEVILEAASGTKDYRHKLHQTISEQRYEINQLTSLLKDNNIDIPEPLPL